MQPNQYTTINEARQYLGISAASVADDALLNRLIHAATSAIDNYCRRHFEARAGTRYYDASAVDGQVLHLDADLLSVLLLRNGDEDRTPFDSYQFRLLPLNDAPAQAILLDSDYSWDTSGDYIAVQGNWGYSAEPPAAIQQACLEYVAYLYRLKDAQTFDVTATPELGVITVPKGMPQSVAVKLAPYVRLVLG